MLKLYTWPTPNSYKVSIMLRECGLPYELSLVDISKGDQFAPAFLAMNPNNKIPVLVDGETTLFESGCILEYLADKTGRFLAPLASPARYETLKWLYWQMAGFGPMLGQNHHFSQYAPEKVPYAIERYLKETARLYSVLDHRLERSEFVGGPELGIADFATYPWVVSHDKQGQKLEDYPFVLRWFERMRARPAVVEAYDEGARVRDGRPTVSEESKSILFGQSGDHLRKK